MLELVMAFWLAIPLKQIEIDFFGQSDNYPIEERLFPNPTDTEVPKRSYWLY